jgi:hypothetical protein
LKKKHNKLSRKPKKQLKLLRSLNKDQKKAIKESIRKESIKKLEEKNNYQSKLNLLALIFLPRRLNVVLSKPSRLRWDL